MYELAPKSILITNNAMDIPGGSETYTYFLAHKLKAKGYNVSVFSPTLGFLAEILNQQQIPCFNQIPPNLNFDLIHAHHQEPSRYVLQKYPQVPVVFLSHGVIAVEETPPIEYIHQIRKFIAVSDEVKDNLLSNYAIKPNLIKVIYNGIDVKHFRPNKRKFNRNAPRFLIISNHWQYPLQLVLDTLTRFVNTNLSLGILGILGNIVKVTNFNFPISLHGLSWNINDLIGEYDIVFTLGRGALEALSCGKPTIILDYHGGDGLVTSNNFSDLKRNNFSGRLQRLSYTPNQLKNIIEGIIGDYETFAKASRQIVVKNFSLSSMVRKLERQYKEVLC